jgi:hypothetical protein
LKRGGRNRSLQKKARDASMLQRPIVELYYGHEPTPLRSEECEISTLLVVPYPSERASASTRQPGSVFLMTGFSKRQHGGETATHKR